MFLVVLEQRPRKFRAVDSLGMLFMVAGRYARESPAVRGETFSIPEAVEAERRIFGDLLEAAA